MRRILVLSALLASFLLATPADAEELAATPTDLECALIGSHVTNFAQVMLNAQASCTGSNRGTAGVFSGGVGWNGPMRQLIGTCFDAESAGPSNFASAFGWNGTVTWTWVGFTMIARGTAIDGAGRKVDVNAVIATPPVNPTVLTDCIGGTPASITYLVHGSLTITDHTSNT